VKIKYSPLIVRDVVPTLAEWRLATPDSDGHWYSRTVNRSPLFQLVDQSLANFEAVPSMASFRAIANAHRAWKNSKPIRHGDVVSRRRVASNDLEACIARHEIFLNDRDRVMNRVEDGLALLQWKSRAISAELYRNPRGGGWAPLTEQDILALELEAQLSSRWANMVPATLEEWSVIGEGESNRLNQWPTLVAGPASRMFLGALQLQVGVNGAWPPWQGVVPFVRKGLFCHSFAALAAEFLFVNRTYLEAGTQFRIHSISVVHQQAAERGGMTHWWVCVNAPSEIDYGRGGPRQLNTFRDYQQLDLVGGFVVDMWGALWDDQLDHEHAKARSNAETAHDCVVVTPGDYLGDTRVVVKARREWA
jgi:hypothetical protein